ncbi:hypothetical protein EW026_g617 [Hermanssonia centrifuga]|uniref:DUF6697 domain-containing protein n=1 Tax=Hermanssonia centrifuga TaxID=98765 RepID=A0A4S4KUA0_9APHY|nr:hypothetical protein EW026_g617 [Hermanssonia centrifuga]
MAERKPYVPPNDHIHSSALFEAHPRLEADAVIPPTERVEVVLTPWAHVKRQRLAAHVHGAEHVKLETGYNPELDVKNNGVRGRAISDRELRENFARLAEIKVEEVETEEQLMDVQIEESTPRTMIPITQNSLQQPSKTSTLQAAGPSVKHEPMDDVIDVDQWDEPVPLSDEELRKAIDLLANPIAKFKKDQQFSYEFVGARLTPMKFARYRIPLDDGYTRFLFSRQYIMNLYGGNSRRTFPFIANKKSNIHGVDDFMMLTLDFSPHAPLNPGDPGLYFGMNKATEWGQFRPLADESERGKERGPERLFVRIRDNLWTYMGMYEMTPTDSLSPTEYCIQSLTSKREWANQIIDRPWGKELCARIALRSRLGREPTPAEVKEGMEDKAILNSVTPAQIERAYSKGEEEIGVWCMKCVDYDIEFQKLLVRNYSVWLKDEGIEKANKKQSEIPRTGRAKASGSKVAGQKRKRGDAGQKEVLLLEDSDIEEVCYVPRGTRGRPQTTTQLEQIS